MGSEEYFASLTSEFPMIKEDIEEEDPGMDHMRMERFADYTIKQIFEQNIPELKRCFDFQESKIELINSKIDNALQVSYCESMLLGPCSNQMDRTVKLMPPKLRAKYAEYSNYYNQLVESSKKK